MAKKKKRFSGLLEFYSVIDWFLYSHTYLLTYFWMNQLSKKNVFPFECPVLPVDFHSEAGSSSRLQQWAHSVPASHYCVEETPRSTAGLQHPGRQGFTVGNLYIQGTRAVLVLKIDFSFSKISALMSSICTVAGGPRLRCPQSRATGRRPGSFCEWSWFPRHRALKSKSA